MIPGIDLAGTVEQSLHLQWKAGDKVICNGWGWARHIWADSVGSTTLANLLSMTKYRGTVAASGLAGGIDLPISVVPFILRRVCLLGIDSVMCLIELRTAVIGLGGPVAPGAFYLLSLR